MESSQHKCVRPLALEETDLWVPSLMLARKRGETRARVQGCSRRIQGQVSGVHQKSTQSFSSVHHQDSFRGAAHQVKVTARKYLGTLLPSASQKMPQSFSLPRLDTCIIHTWDLSPQGKNSGDQWWHTEKQTLTRTGWISLEVLQKSWLLITVR